MSTVHEHHFPNNTLAKCNGAGVVVGDINATPHPFFTYTKCLAKLKVVRVDVGIKGADQEAECQKLNTNYHALKMDDPLAFEVS